jgi:hypothetical protein
MLNSVVCRAEHFFEPWYREWAERLKVDDCAKSVGQRNFHRKAWEWAAVVQALFERGKLHPGARGIGFAVGTEKLPSLFASMGCTILASDVGDQAIAENWRRSGEYAGALDALYCPEFLSRPDFESKVSYSHIDMRDLSQLIPGSYDFLWSSCSFEHLGDLRKGLDFVLGSTRLLKASGVAVHTTEFNLSSDKETIEAGDTVIYRERDLRLLDGELRKIGAGLVALDLFGGTHEFDIKYDYVPYHGNGRKHVKLRISDFVCTSVLLIIQN